MAWHLLLMLVTCCCRMASHSSTSICCKCSQRCCVGHFGTNSTPKLIPQVQVFSGVEVRTAGRTNHPLHSQILEEDSDKPLCVGGGVVILEDRVWSQAVVIWNWPLVSEFKFKSLNCQYVFIEVWRNNQESTAKIEEKEKMFGFGRQHLTSNPHPTNAFFVRTIWSIKEALLQQRSNLPNTFFLIFLCLGILH